MAMDYVIDRYILKCWCKNKFNEYFTIIQNNKGCLSFNTGLPEYEWTKSEVLQYFNVNEDDILNSDQRLGGLHIIRKCDFTMNVYNKWWTIAKENPGLFDDCFCRNTNYNLDFIENRHDQSVWSLICKTMDVPLSLDKPSSRPIKASRIRK